MPPRSVPPQSPDADDDDPDLEGQSAEHEVDSGEPLHDDEGDYPDEAEPLEHDDAAYLDDEQPADDAPAARERDERALQREKLQAAVLTWLKRGAVTLLVLLVAALLGLFLLLEHYERDLPSTAELKNYDPPQVTRVLARDGSLLAELFVERRTLVPIDRIPRAMKVAALAAEDADFYRHEGLDYFGMLRALLVNVRSGSMKQGGSTITQQVVKNVLLTQDRTFARKAQEVLLARRIEQELSKDEILELYLNHIYFGHGRYGVEEASRYYFGKGIADVTPAEAALLAALPKGPSVYSPRVNPAKARTRRDSILDQMVLKGFADAGEVEEIKREPVVLAPATESLPELAPEAVDEVRRRLRDIVGPVAARGGYTVTTTIDPELQAAARAALRKNLDAYAERHGLVAPLKRPKREPAPFQGTPEAQGHHVYNAVVVGGNDAKGELKVRVGSVDGVVRLRDAARYNPKNLAPSKFAETGTIVRVSPVLDRGVGKDGAPHEFRLELGPQSALVAIDVATREVRALAGSYEAVRSGLDRASFSKRQPGSSFKPFVYGYAIHSRKMTAASVVERPLPAGAAPAMVDADGGVGIQPPKPPLRMREAIARSVNQAAEFTLAEVGAENVVTWAHSAGIESQLGATPSLALGAYEVTPRELAGAYTTFAGGGVYEEPVLITRIVGPDGAEIALPEAPAPRRAMEDAEAYVITSLLTSVVDRGTARRARDLGIPLAGKTGTSNEAKDAWFAGYSPDMVCVVWTGYDDSQPLGRGESGAASALPAFIDFMRATTKGKKPKGWTRPQGVAEVAIDPLSGLLAYPNQENPLREVFLRGTEPESIAEPTLAAGGAGPGQEPLATEPTPPPEPTPAPAPSAQTTEPGAEHARIEPPPAMATDPRPPF
jgi:penicillin-binding protein 1A